MTPNDLPALWRRIETAGEADFLVQPDRRFSHRDLTLAVRQWLGAFDAAGVTCGDRVVIQTAAEDAAISGFLAALFDGIVPVLLAAETPLPRARALCATVAAAAMVVDAGVETVAGVPVIMLPLVGAPARRGLFARRPAAAMLPGAFGAASVREPGLPADPAGLAYILFTSGTTSAPVGVAITRGNLFANLATLGRLFGYDAGSRIFNDMILAHADGMIQGPVLAAAHGCAVIRSGGFQIGGMEAWLGRVRESRATHIITVPTIWSMIDQFASHDDYFDAPECRSLVSVAAKLPAPLWQRLEARFERPVFNQYGLTETVASALYAGPHPEMGTFASVGKPVDCEARIDPAAAGDEGELQLRGDNVFAGYWNDDARTAASFTDDGWLKTGDLARRRADGSYDLLGRVKTVIMSGGFLIRPDEIDEAMLVHPDIVESATIGIADAMFDEVAVTAVVCRQPVDEATLTAHARTLLEPQKVPKRIVQVDAIPRGDAGKPNIGRVRQLLADAVSANSAAAPGGDTEQAVMAVAAEVFRVDPGTLSSRTAHGGIKGWDSFSQLALLLAVEHRFKIRISAGRIAAIRTLGDIVRMVEDTRP